MLSCWDDHWQIVVLSLTVISLRSSFWSGEFRPADFAVSKERKCWIDAMISETVRVVVRKAVAHIMEHRVGVAAFLDM